MKSKVDHTVNGDIARDAQSAAEAILAIKDGAGATDSVITMVQEPKKYKTVSEGMNTGKFTDGTSERLVFNTIRGS